MVPITNLNFMSSNRKFSVRLSLTNLIAILISLKVRKSIFQTNNILTNILELQVSTRKNKIKK